MKEKVEKRFKNEDIFLVGFVVGFTVAVLGFFLGFLSTMAPINF